MLHKLKILADALIGYVIKWKYDLTGIRGLPSIQHANVTRHPEFIVSLTSYGRRVNKVVYYTIVSILKQSFLPDRIILWLDNDNWNENNIPLRLNKLCSKGLEIRFCEDLKSYKKLIPTLTEYPEDIIVTIDDDVIYTQNFLKHLWDSYRKSPSQIHCSKALLPQLENGETVTLAPYTKWLEIPPEQTDADTLKFPVGVGGILYPPHALFKETTNIHTFKNLCPMADDIWFWSMALKNGTGHTKIAIRKPFYSFDSIYQFFHYGSALTHSNAKESKNDDQLKNIIDYFKLESTIVQSIKYNTES